MKKKSKGINHLLIHSEVKKNNDICLLNKKLFFSPTDRKSKKIKLSPFPSSALLQFQEFTKYYEKKNRLSSISTSIETQGVKEKNTLILHKKPKKLFDKLSSHSTNVSVTPISMKDIYTSLNHFSYENVEKKEKNSLPLNIKAHAISKSLNVVPNKIINNKIQINFTRAVITIKQNKFISKLQDEIQNIEIKNIMNDQKKLLITQSITNIQAKHNRIIKKNMKKYKKEYPDNYGLILMYNQEYYPYLLSRDLFESMNLIFDIRTTKVWWCNNKVPLVVSNSYAEKYFDLRDQMLKYIKEQFTVTFRRDNRSTSLGRTNIENTNGFLVHIMKNESLFEKEDHFFINSFSIRIWKNETESKNNIYKAYCYNINSNTISINGASSKRDSTFRAKLKKNKKIQKIDKNYILLKNKEIFSVTARDTKIMGSLKQLLDPNNKDDTLKRKLYDKLFNIKKQLDKPKSNRDSKKLDLNMIKKIPFIKFNNLVSLLQSQNEDTFKYSINSIAHKYDINTFDDGKHNTLLNYSVQNNLINSTKLLLNLGADPNIANIFKNTPLHYAISHKNYDNTNLLIQHGADELMVNDEGLQPWKCLGISCKK